MERQEPTKTDLLLAANRLGEMLSQVGDFFDVVEELTRGYARGLPGTTSSAEDSPSVAAAAKHQYIQQQIGALVEIRSVAENILEWRVEDARDALMSWQDIADVIGISRQATHKRYSGRGDITDYPAL